jgi:hypothetical protein
VGRDELDSSRGRRPQSGPASDISRTQQRQKRPREAVRLHRASRNELRWHYQAPLYGGIELWEPTIIVDEADSILIDNEPLRTVINSGWTRGDGVPRSINDNQIPHLFPTFCPKAIAMKGLSRPLKFASTCW